MSSFIGNRRISFFFFGLAKNDSFSRGVHDIMSHARSVMFSVFNLKSFKTLVYCVTLI